MRKPYALLLMTCLNLTINSASGTTSINEFEIMHSGQYHGNEIQASYGKSKTWLGLYVSKKRGELRKTETHVRRVFDGIVDDEKYPARYSGKLVESLNGDPVLMIKSTSLKTGKIATAPIDGNQQGFELFGRHFEIKHQCKTSSQDPSLLDCEVFLSDGQTQQMLGQTTESKEGKQDESLNTLELIWAGDLDRDGRADLILRNSHYNGENTQLWLSSKAGKQELIKLVTTVARVGC